MRRAYVAGGDQADAYLEPQPPSIYTHHARIGITLIQYRDTVPTRTVTGSFPLDGILEALAAAMQESKGNIEPQAFAAMLHALAAKLRETTQRDEHKPRAKALARAALLADLAAALVEHPELIDKLPGDIEAVTAQATRGPLDEILKAAKTAEVVD